MSISAHKPAAVTFRRRPFSTLALTKRVGVQPSPSLAVVCRATVRGLLPSVLRASTPSSASAAAKRAKNAGSDDDIKRRNRCATTAIYASAPLRPLRQSAVFQIGLWRPAWRSWRRRERRSM